MRHRISIACVSAAIACASARSLAHAADPPPSFIGTKAGQVRDDNGLKMKLVWCPPGKFRMGSPKNETGRFLNEGQVDVTLTKGFWLGKYEVTQLEWLTVMSTTPWRQAAAPDRLRTSFKKHDDYPAMCMSLWAAPDFCTSRYESQTNSFEPSIAARGAAGTLKGPSSPCGVQRAANAAGVA